MFGLPLYDFDPPDLRQPGFTDFPLEWLALFIVVGLEIFLVPRTNFSISVVPGNFFYVALLLLGVLISRMVVIHRRLALGVEFIALIFFSAPVFAVATYIAASVPYPLWDQECIRLDQALGFQWLNYFHYMNSHPSWVAALVLCYNSFIWQLYLVTIVFAWLGWKKRIREFFWILFLTSIVTTAVFCAFPTLGPLAVYDIAHREPSVNLRGAANYIDVLTALRSKANLHFSLQEVKGIIAFPSYHTVMALLFCYSFRRSGGLFWIVVLINLGMLVVIPSSGGHYLCDVIAGAMVLAASIAVVRKALWRKMEPHSEDTRRVDVLSALFALFRREIFLVE